MTFAMTYGELATDIQVYAERTNDARFIAAIPTFVLFAQRRIARELKILGMQEYVTNTFTATEGVMAKPKRWLQTISMNYGGQNGVVYRADVTNPGSGYQFPPLITGGNGTTFLGHLVNGALNQIGVVNGGTANLPGPFPLTIANADNDSTGVGATATASSYVGNNRRRGILPRSLEYCRAYWPDATQIRDPKFYADYNFDHWLFAPTPQAALPIEIGYYQITDLIDDEHQTNWLTDNAPDLLLYACLLETYPFLKNVEQQQLWQGMYDRAAAGFVTEDQGRVADRSTVRTPALAGAGSPPPQGGGAPR